MGSSAIPRRTAVRLAVLGAAGAGAAGAMGAGTTPAVASDSRQGRTPAGRDRCDPTDPARPKRQLRGVWVASVDNIDWPSETGLDAERQQHELRALYDEAVRLDLNAVFVQVRPTADAFWRSPYEPWSKWLTGTQGEDPGYDPLAFAVREAHARNLEFHAWFNPYRITLDSEDPATLVPEHPAQQHPEWVIAYGGMLYYDPGRPDVQAFCQDAIMDAVEKYDLDGVHFDDYFYPYPVEGEEFDDRATFEEYGGDFDDLGDWRRDNVNTLIRDLGERVHRHKPWVRYGVSPFGVWRNAATDPEGSDTEAGAQTYDDLYADTRLWVREEWIDYVLPQIYWEIGQPLADYAALVPWWSEQVRDTAVALWIGQASYKVADPEQEAPWQDPTEMSRHLRLNREHPEVSGDVYFSAKDVVADRLGHLKAVHEEHYSRPALVPVLDQLGGHRPRPPVALTARRGPDGVELHWIDPGAIGASGSSTTAYAVYRLDTENTQDTGNTKDTDRAGRAPIDPCDLADATRLVAVHRAERTTRQHFVDESADPGRSTVYAVAALNRRQLESRPTAARVRRR